jgi:hypothetical protein
VLKSINKNTMVSGILIGIVGVAFLVGGAYWLAGQIDK